MTAISIAKPPGKNVITLLMCAQTVQTIENQDCALHIDNSRANWLNLSVRQSRIV